MLLNCNPGWREKYREVEEGRGSAHETKSSTPPHWPEPAEMKLVWKVIESAADRTAHRFEVRKSGTDF